MWIAKNKDTGFEYPKKFNDIMDCQKYIDKELKDDLLKAKKDFVLGYMDSHKGAIPFFFSNRILCWNVEQKRFCDGFDF